MGFLVLARRLNERILIGDDIEILIADIRENRDGELVVDVAINAPKPKYKILKHETYLKDLKGFKKNGPTARNQSR